MKKTQLKRKTIKNDRYCPECRQLKKTPIRKISAKQREKNRIWASIVKERCEMIERIYGVPVCEACMKTFSNCSELWYKGGHHLDRNRNNNTPDNCYVCHNLCHSIITDNNLNVAQLDFYLRYKVCWECLQYRPEDERVKNGMKCARCAYE